MDTDPQLLRRYVSEHSESAFTQLVQRHVGLVYSVALRRVGGDAHLAQDVAQKVFCDLSRKASTLTDRATLAGWLYASTHLTSAGVVRSEQRRKARETEAHLMQTTLSSPETDADWTRLRPILDDIIVTLKDEEREAIALRFFEKRSFADVGSALRITEEAARKRVDRVLDKLRAVLARRGITSTTAVLGLTLAGLSSASVPAEITAKIVVHALGQAGLTAGASTATTLASALLPAAAVLMVGGFLITSQRHSNQQLQTEIAQLTAKNHEIADVRTANKQLAKSIAQTEDAQRAQRALVASTPPSSDPAQPTSRPISARLSITPERTITWDGIPITLDEFVLRLAKLQATAKPESRINIRAAGTDFTALAYAVDEVRKSQSNHVTIESDATPNPGFGASWF